MHKSEMLLCTYCARISSFKNSVKLNATNMSAYYCIDLKADLYFFCQINQKIIINLKLLAR